MGRAPNRQGLVRGFEKRNLKNNWQRSIFASLLFDMKKAYRVCQLQAAENGTCNGMWESNRNTARFPESQL